MRRVGLVLLLAGAGFIGCSSGASNRATSESDAGPAVSWEDRPSDLPCEIEDVFARRCRSCHTAPPQFGAPMPLVSHAQVTGALSAIIDRVHRAPEAVGRMPQKPTPPLTPEELATLDAWVARGAPAGACAVGAAPNPKAKPLSCKPDLSMRAATKFAMPRDSRDLYACYGFDYEVGEKRHITGVAPRVQNSKIVHHILLMQADDTVDPTPVRCSGGIGKYRLLYAWAPGVGSFELPAVAGLPAEKGKTHFVVQTHYNNLSALDGETDDSGFDVCTTNHLRPNDADVVAFGSMRFSIPARGKLDLTATYLVPASMGEVHAIGAFPHMHKLGKSIVTALEPAGSGAPIDLGADRSFEFGSQFFAPLSDVVIRPGDVVRTRCVWQNPSDREVTFGENTDDEMCFSFTLYYPKVREPSWIWALPAFAAATESN